MTDNEQQFDGFVVAGFFEVKQTFKKKWVRYAGEKAASVRQLRRTSVAIPHVMGTS